MRVKGFSICDIHKISITDDLFEIVNWQDAELAPDKVYEVKVNNLSGAANDVCTACAYIDGEYMGAFTFDENGLATLALNTTGLEKGEHLYKVIFKSGNNSTIERLMRFRVGDSAK